MPNVQPSKEEEINSQTCDLLTLTPVMPNVQPQTKEPTPDFNPPNKRKVKHKETK